MNATRQKMSNIVDELINFFFHVGSDHIQIDLKKCSDGYELYLKSSYLPQERKKIDDLNRFLCPVERNEGLEEFFWELAGLSSGGTDSELHLIGQMIDRAQVEIGDSEVTLTLFKKAD